MTWALPWPDAGEREEIHAASTVAFHVHSDCVVTASVPAPPPEPMSDEPEATVTAHLTGVGVVDVVTVDVEPQLASMVAAMDKRTTAARDNPVGRTDRIDGSNSAEVVIIPRVRLNS